MKNILKYNILFCFSMLFFIACDDNNSLHQKYLDEGETIYLGSITNVEANSGFNKVQFKWWNSSDPRIKKTTFYWDENDEAKSHTATVSGVDQQDLTLNLPEGIYSFKLINEDNSSNRSLGYEAIVEIYGQQYKESLRNLGISQMVVSNAQDSVTINWAGIESITQQYTTVAYYRGANANPLIGPLRVENEELKTIITASGGFRAQTGDSIMITSTYKPENGIDMVDAIPRKISVLE